MPATYTKVPLPAPNYLVDGWQRVTPLYTVLSSTCCSGYDASKCFDGVVSATSTCATTHVPAGGNRVVAELPAGTRIGVVAVHNRQDAGWARPAMGTLQVWVTTNGYISGGVTFCGEASYSPTDAADEPYVFDCDSSDSADTVVVVQTSCPTTYSCALVLSEVAIYEAPLPPSLPPSPPPSPPPPSPPPPSPPPMCLRAPRSAWCGRAVLNAC